ncbi:negative regulator of Ofd1/Enhancer of translation termination 1 [Lipomyces chichibuensis]|uniref:negative regulator of Ofd1/Enhancer of translation termination 1 n=1 Tax=Lipomyces chichibuensis TaxID=1546026 RepID=UPI0033442B3A
MSTKSTGPQGLARSAKRRKVANEDPLTIEQETIELPEDIDPEDELGQLYALHSSYLKSTKESPKLLYAIVHECDRQLRNSKTLLPPKFHKVYAEALSMLSVFAKKKKSRSTPVATGEQSAASSAADSPEDFLLASIERAQIGLETYPKSIDILVVRCETYLALVELRLKNSAKSKNVEGCVSAIQNATKDYDEALKLLTELQRKFTEDGKKDEEDAKGDADVTEITPEHLVKVLRRLSKVLETTLESDFIAERFPDLYLWNEDRWAAELHDAPEDKFLHRGLGEFYLARAYPYVATVESQFEDDNSDSEDEELDRQPSNIASEQAKQFLSKSLEHLYAAESDEDNGAFLAVIAEAQISLANLESEEDKQNKLYAEAIKRLLKAQELGAGDFTDMINELQNA